MSKLNVDQASIMKLFSDRKSDFLIPDYQRPYAWDEDLCQTLWDDIFSFAIPDNDAYKFNTNEEYFLGSIVTFKNDDDKLEVIDGQQRLTTLMLLLRAFYGRFEMMSDENSRKMRERISNCIWKADEFGNADMNILKIDSEVATDDDKEEFLSILKTGEAPMNLKSNYANNYRFFQEKIDQFLQNYPSYFPFLPARILENCILLPIEAESQDTALRIFSTLNDRGMPLSDADIFKAQFYGFYKTRGEYERESFISQWRELESVCKKNFHPSTGTPMDELFTRYMYFVRAKKGVKSTTTEALRKFYERDKYAILKNDTTFQDLKILANFWNDINEQNSERFLLGVLRKLRILDFAPNGMWSYFISVYFMQNKDEDEMLDNESFEKFLTKTIAFVWAYAILRPGVNALRTPIFAEMVNIVNNKNVTFNEFKFDFEQTKVAFYNYDFRNTRPITKSMLALRMLNFEEQKLPEASTLFEIEHIFAKNRQANERTLKDARNLESLGNKALLEKKINIRASDYRFEDKVKYYVGFTNDRGQHRPGTIDYELIELSRKPDFTEADIESRNHEIIDQFLNYLKENELVQELAKGV